MCNKFKLKKKLLSIALALVLAAQPLMSLPMNVFAGTDKIGLTTMTTETIVESTPVTGTTTGVAEPADGAVPGPLTSTIPGPVQ